MKITFLLAFLFTTGHTHAQSTDALLRFDKISFTALYSKGYEQRSVSIATMVENAHSYHKKLLNYDTASVFLYRILQTGKLTAARERYSIAAPATKQ